MNRVLCWLRRDIRLQDNRILERAAELGDQVVVAYVLEETSVVSRAENRRAAFLWGAISELSRNLEALGSRLIVVRGNPIEQLPRLADQLRITHVVLGSDTEPAARKRDAAVIDSLRVRGIKTETVADGLLFPAGSITKKDGKPYTVFTPFARALAARLNNDTVKSAKFHAKKLLPSNNIPTHTELGADGVCPLSQQNHHATSLNMPVGEQGAAKQLCNFLTRIDAYHNERNRPDRTGTSHLSTALSFGTISIRTCARAAMESESSGRSSWLNQLIWREFFHNILFEFPHVAEREFLDKYHSISWPGHTNHLSRWIAGETGYPIVDAAMRQFAETGWIHNRLRMIVASFLTKDLLCSWQHGELHFASGLLDYDLASNNGGWQWAASTGCDPQPYFRVFNPFLQGKKFDPEGEFIAQQIPELARLPARYRHAPALAPESVLRSCNFSLNRDYPAPIVDHATQRLKAIRLFKISSTPLQRNPQMPYR